MVCKDRPGRLDNKELMDSVVHKVEQVRKVHRDRLGYLVRLEHKDNRESEGLGDNLG